MISFDTKLSNVQNGSDSDEDDDDYSDSEEEDEGDAVEQVRASLRLS